ncbi:hypothetical protein AB9K26_02645 [Psychroserpens sp. XS_ASV72]|uniref:hypothetical protein n=1 Tax=Psychroserpens sp. XS_ASV72 TaxID=3241293 RepID=UPI00351551D6
MKAVSVVTIKKELQHRSQDELIQLCLRLSKFKKENKELLTYLLFEAHDETAYVESVKDFVDLEFEAINTNSYYYIRKSVRKILRHVKKYARYSGRKDTEIELLLHFCKNMKLLSPSIKFNKTLINSYNRQLALAEKHISNLHEDLQYDYGLMVEELGFIS